MPRPRKHRKVCHFPRTLSFAPVDDVPEEAPIILSVDEYETLRLIDREGFSQEECGEWMGVARTTVQMIYMSARKKLADVLVEGRSFRIEGGDYRICNGETDACGHNACFKQKLFTQYQKQKDSNLMRSAVTYENGNIFQRFGHTRMFKVYDVLDGKIVSSQVVDTNGSGHGALAGVLLALQADVLICGGIGGAQMALASAGIKLYGGVSGNADAAVEAFLAGSLDYDPNVKCSHHGEHHHEEGHNCGNHGCGSHSCH